MIKIILKMTFLKLFKDTLLRTVYGSFCFSEHKTKYNMMNVPQNSPFYIEGKPTPGHFL